MPRFSRPPTGGIVCHVLNRANARLPLFEQTGDYELFERTLEQAHQRVPMRTLAYCVMPNHRPLVRRPRAHADLPEFMRSLTLTHTQRRHAAVGGRHGHQAGPANHPPTPRPTEERPRKTFLTPLPPLSPLDPFFPNISSWC